MSPPHSPDSRIDQSDEPFSDAAPITTRDPKRPEPPVADKPRQLVTMPRIAQNAAHQGVMPFVAPGSAASPVRPISRATAPGLAPPAGEAVMPFLASLAEPPPPSAPPKASAARPFAPRVMNAGTGPLPPGALAATKPLSRESAKSAAAPATPASVEAPAPAARSQAGSAPGPWASGHTKSIDHGPLPSAFAPRPSTGDSDDDDLDEPDPDQAWLAYAVGSASFALGVLLTCMVMQPWDRPPEAPAAEAAMQVPVQVPAPSVDAPSAPREVTRPPAASATEAPSAVAPPPPPPVRSAAPPVKPAAPAAPAKPPIPPRKTTPIKGDPF